MKPTVKESQEPKATSKETSMLNGHRSASLQGLSSTGAWLEDAREGAEAGGAALN